MDVLCLVPTTDRPLFQRSLAPRHTVHFADRWVDAEPVIRRHPVGALVADLAIEGKPEPGKLRQLRTMFPSVAAVVWVSLDHEVARALADCGAAGVTRVLVRGYDNDPRVIAQTVADGLAEGTYARTLDLVLAELGPETPARLRWVLREILEAPDRVRTAEELARRARVETRTIFRWFRRAKLATPHTVITAARVLVAGRMLQDPGLTVDDVARRLGYSDARYLTEHARRLAGMTAAELRLSFAEAVPRLAAAMLAEPDALAHRVRRLVP
jgi:AraC-like DNA-binding protein